MTEPRLIFDRVWKKFHRGEIHDSLRDLIPAMLRKATGRAPSKAELQSGDFWAVRDLSFEVRPGQTLGIIGPNGSGKSTTLKLLTRIYEPSRGHCSITGRVGALIEVSAGFHGDLTGRENVFLQGAIMGMRSKDITRKFDEIVEFSGISEFIDTQVKRYSSGMNARLGFSIAAHLEPDVLIIDEVLAVGDMSFQERAFGRIRELAQSGLPVVMVSHQLDRVAELCTDVIVLNRGEVMARGTPSDAISAYVQQHDATRATITSNRITFDPVEIATDMPVRSGDTFDIRVSGRVMEALNDTVEPLAIRVRSLRSGGIVYSSGSRRVGLDLGNPGAFDVHVTLQANVPAGSYMVEVGAQDLLKRKDFATAPSTMIQVAEGIGFKGSVQMNADMRVLAGRTTS
jgi:ABC-type polysaccharide/polyol phosphate transport system ATPase subunit